MSDERLFSLRNPWFRASVGGTLGIALVSAFVGFVWLPSVQRDAQFQGVWNAICSAAGVPRQWLAGGDAPVMPAYPVSHVEVTPQLLSDATRLSIGRGATLSLRCTMCHGEKGMSNANSPNLAGQYAIAVYKQLRDFAGDARQNAVMSPMVRGLGDQDMRDLAAYYASLPRPAARRTGDAPDIVVHGAPMRNIPACAACHGGIDHQTGSPWLDGLPAAYTKTQLVDFASGARHNDTSEQMRNIARNLTPDEIAAAAAWYAGVAH
ncbi:cytochrome C [Burkholderia lata]|uniref:Cytochrome C n=1 Tax=Burkholderia lata (strain ATCC 17760 / DSM 23089 / LMG 22485 / NCIMB 9086 / R18194 / 383) TaxID=482957 RepID=A0A6P2WHC0_BURL3|nr:c-type cytochrome [Burkholderia lata]VWC90821.1 cytochrome C [Burkholderia lata]